MTLYGVVVECKGEIFSTFMSFTYCFLLIFVIRIMKEFVLKEWLAFPINKNMTDCL